MRKDRVEGGKEIVIMTRDSVGRMTYDGVFHAIWALAGMRSRFRECG